jgi:ADP-heptose:LPS heptosyltransferase
VETAIFLGWNALGDTLCTTPALRAFRRAHPRARVLYVVQNAEFCRILEGNRDVDLVLYSDALYVQGLAAATPEWVAGLPLALERPAHLLRFDLRFVCTHEGAFQEHISVGFARALGLQLDSLRPVVALDERDRRAARFVAPRPYVALSLSSISNPRRADGEGRKDWPLERWAALCERLLARGFDVLALGSERDPRPALPAGVRLLHGLPIRVVAALIEGAACFVTLENGLAHLAAAFDAPTVELYSDVVPLAWARPAESTRLSLLYGDPRDFGVEQVDACVEERLVASRALA